MAKEVYFFSHDFYSRCDTKLVNVSRKYGMAGIGVFWCLVEMVHEGCGFADYDCERIAFELRVDVSMIEDIINNYDLFHLKEQYFYSDSALERIAIKGQKSEKARKSAYARWNKVIGNDDCVPD